MIEGVEIHYQFAKSSAPDAIPMIFSHGWPGSFFEANLLLPLLTNPQNGGQAFHVVVPSLVGYNFSGPPPRAGWTLQDTARLFSTLMTSVLGFGSWTAHGGDWGSGERPRRNLAERSFESWILMIAIQRSELKGLFSFRTHSSPFLSLLSPPLVFSRHSLSSQLSRMQSLPHELCSSIRSTLC